MNEPKSRKYKALTLTQLRTFCVVCRDAGYAAAARTLDLTTTAVWEQMQSLERLYGTKLLERAGMGVGITVGTGRGHLYSGLGVRSLRRWFGSARVGFQWPRRAHLTLAQRELADAVAAELAAGPAGERG